MTLERLLFDCETLHTLEGLFEISLDLLGTSLGGPGFDISPTPELSTARLAFDGGVIVYGIGLRNPVQGGHRLRWKADTRTVIADTW